MIIKQEKSNAALKLYSDAIIDSLRNMNVAEKYKIISCLYNSLTDLIKEEGIIVELRK